MAAVAILARLVYRMTGGALSCSVPAPWLKEVQ